MIPKQQHLAEYVVDWHPAPTTETDHLDPAQANRMARTLDIDERRSAGDELPVPWHWVYFPNWPTTALLGADGHPADGQFFPPIPHRRRMFAGSKMEVSRPLRLGKETEKRSEVIRTEEKQGRGGAMLFVTVRSEYRQDGQLCLAEEQSVVYHSYQGTPRSHQRTERPGTDLTPAAAQWAVELAPTSTTLFRYSALTSNSHRIHYDQAYSSDTEGYPDIVVHGPLLATYLADLVRIRSGRPLRQFAFRLKRPIFLGDYFRGEASQDEDGATVAMRIVTGTDEEHVTASGILA